MINLISLSAFNRVNIKFFISPVLCCLFFFSLAQNEIDSLKMLRDSLKRKLQNQLRELYIIRYDEDAGSKVAMGQIWTGMTEEMMRDSWGEPDSITVNDQKWGKYTQWYYGEITYFFKDGKLFEWENKGVKNK